MEIDLPLFPVSVMDAWNGFLASVRGAQESFESFSKRLEEFEKSRMKSVSALCENAIDRDCNQDSFSSNRATSSKVPIARMHVVEKKKAFSALFTKILKMRLVGFSIVLLSLSLSHSSSSSSSSLDSSDCVRV